MRGGGFAFHVLLCPPFHSLRRAEGPLAEGLEGWGATCHPFGLEVHVRFVLEMSRLSSLYIEVEQSSSLKPGFPTRLPRCGPAPHAAQAVSPCCRCPPWPGRPGLLTPGRKRPGRSTLDGRSRLREDV